MKVGRTLKGHLALSAEDRSRPSPQTARRPIDYDTGKILGMTNIATALRFEIARIARKEMKAETQSLKSASTKYRSDIAALKRQVAALQNDLRRAAKASPTSLKAAAGKTPEVRHRFSATGLVSQRKRLGLSAEAMGKLIGVSGLSIYHWEGGKSRPRDRHLPAITALKTLGKKDALAVLAAR